MGFKKRQADGTYTSIPIIHGKSAYQIALENGFIGTEQEWLNSLHGNSVLPTETITTISNGDFLHVENDGTLKKISKDNFMNMIIAEITTKFTTEENINGGTDLKFNNTIIWTHEESASQIGSISSTDNTIILDNIAAGTYTLKYEDENGNPLSDYKDITTMEVQ